jgi:hypothetical protein
MSETLQDKTKKSLWDLIKVFIPLVTAILTAILGFMLGSVTEEKKYIADVQLQNQSYILQQRQSAYTNFFEGQAKLRESQRLETAGSTDAAAKLHQEYELEINNAVFQIAISSTKQVNDSLARYFQTAFKYGPCVGDKQKLINDTQIYQSMRQEVFGNNSEERIDDQTMRILLFQCTTLP